MARPTLPRLRRASIVPWVVASVGAGSLFAVLPLNASLSGTVFTVLLMSLSMIDIRTNLLPDALTFPLIGLGLGLSIAGYKPSLLDAVLGGLFGYGVIAAIAQVYRRSRGIEGLGLGDAKLLCGLGVWTGGLMLPFIVFIASMAGLGWYAARNFRAFSLRHQMPFGPFLAGAGWLAFIAVHSGIEPMAFLASQFTDLME